MTEERYKVKKFSLGRVFAVAGRVLTSFRRDHRTFAMMIVMPLLFMFVFGLVLSGDINNVPVLIENNDEAFGPLEFGNDIYTALLNDNDERLEVEIGNYDDGIAKVESADLVASILIPGNFSRDLALYGNATLTIYIDATKPQIKATVYSAISDAMQETLEGRGIVFDEEIAFGGAEFSGLDVSIPSVMGYILTFLILLISVLTAIREDISNTKLRLFTTPLTPVERILGYMFALILFAMLETALVILIALLIFGTTIQGSLSLLFFAGFLYGMAHIFLAFFLSNFAKNEFQSVQLAVLVAIPSLAFSGMMVPITTFPPILAAISKFIPLTYGIQAFEGIMLRGWGLEELWFEFSLIGVLSVAFFVLALISSSDKSKD